MIGSRSQRGQAGMTLVEILLGLSITVMVILPLGAWTFGVLRTQNVAGDKMMRTIHTGFVGAYLPDDVASSIAADDLSGATPPADQEWWSDWSRSDCVGGGGANGRKLLILLAQQDAVLTSTTSTTSTTAAPATLGAEQVKIIYSIAPSSESAKGGAQSFSIWRRSCSATDHSPLIESRELFQQIDPLLARTRAECSSVATELPCREVKLLLTPVGARRPVIMNVLRRTDAAPKLTIDDGSATGNHVPAARVSVTSITPTGNGQQSEVRLDASASSDEDGSIIDYRWRIPSAPVDAPGTYTEVGGPGAVHQTIILPRAGRYSVELTVTDDKGASTTTHRRIVIENRKPVAVGSVSVTRLVKGAESFALQGSASYDPDGTVDSAASHWILSGTTAAGEAGRIKLDGLDHSGLVLGEEWSPGTVTAALVVIDDDGDSDVFATTFELVEPEAPEPVEGP